MASKRKDYPGYIQRRGPGRYRVRLTVSGEEYEATLTDTTLEEAQDHLVAKKQELLADAKRRKLGMPTGTRFSGLLRHYRERVLPTLRSELTQRSHAKTLRAVERYFAVELGDPKLRDVHSGLIEE